MKVWLSWHAYKVCWDCSRSEKKCMGSHLQFAVALDSHCIFLSSAEQNQQKPQLLKEAVMLCAVSNRDDKLLQTPRQ